MAVLLRLSTVSLLVLSLFLSAVSALPQLNPAERINLKKRGGSEEYVTNAARMAVGLGPAMPRNLFDPSRVKVAREPSAVPHAD